jgi:hypothetical protein
MVVHHCYMFRYVCAVPREFVTVKIRHLLFHKTHHIVHLY